MKSKIGNFNTPSGQGERADVVLVDGKAYGANEIRALLANQLPKGYVTVPLEVWEVMCEHERERDALAGRAEKAEMELVKLSMDYNVARDRHDALAAKVEMLRNAWESVKDIDWNKPLDEAFEATPQQCLRELQAEAGRAGFIEGVRQARENEIGWFGNNIESCANQYAATVRQGEQSGTWLKDSNVNGGNRQGGAE